jgi:hypothetical protein
MVGHDNAITCIESILLSLEEVIRVVKVHALLPPLSGLLVSLEVWVVSDEDP